MSAETIHDLLANTDPRHGSRSRYVIGCRCDECRSANLRNYHEREARSREAVESIPRAPGSICPGWNGEPCPRRKKLRSDSAGVCADCRKRAVWNGLVDATPARKHIRRMSRLGVGYRTLADAAGVNTSTTRQVMTGEKKTIRKSTLERLLSVDEGARADHALIPAGETKRILRELEPEFLTKRNLAAALGYRSYGIPSAKRITVRNADRIRRFRDRVAPLEEAAP